MTLVDLKAKCEKVDAVSEADWKQAQTRFRMMGACMPGDDWQAELQAFKDIRNGYEKGSMVEYW
jgi:hypothetical protein